MPGHEPTMCAPIPEGQQYPGLHQGKHGQHIEEGDPAPLLLSGETSPRVLCPALDSVFMSSAQCPQDMDLSVQDKGRARKMIGVVKNLCYGNRLRH